MASDWEQTAEGFRLYLVAKASSSETIRTYHVYNRIAFRWLESRGFDLVCADKVTLARLIEDYGHGRKRHTIRNLVGAMRAFYTYAVAEGLRDDNPALALSRRKPRQQPKRPFSLEELQALMDAATAPVDHALLCVLTATALRIGEAVRLDVEDVDMKRRIALLRGKGDRERWVKVFPTAVKCLQRYLDGRRTGPVFLTEAGERMTRARAWKRLVAVGLRAGVINVYPHRFRTTCANFFLTGGGDLAALKEIMGHEDIRTTERYAGYSQAQRALDQMDRFNPLAELT